MITEERSFCIYCRRELQKKDEVNNGYHIYCREEFEKEFSDLPVYDQDEVLRFKKLVDTKVIRLEHASIILLIVFFIPIIIFKTIYANNILYVCFFILEISFIPIFGIQIYKYKEIKEFCNLIVQINPHYQYLNTKFCIIKLGSVYVIHKSSLFDSSGIFLVKLLEEDTINESKLNIPSVFFITELNKEKYNITLARKQKTCQIPIDEYRSLIGKGIVYITSKETVFDKLGSLTNLIYLMNRDTAMDFPDLQDISKISILIKYFKPIMGTFLIFAVLIVLGLI